ncbi:MAG: HAD family phosphatase, partial [Firmicutes bacterium]|nr:HAD family phosphatase [Bacillota bacterium]
MIKNFVFDMGEVLIHFDIRAFADRYDITEEEKELVLREVFWGNANWSLNDWGRIDEAEVARRACERLPERLHEAAWGLATRWFDPLMPVEGMADLVRRVKNAGYGVYLLSNAGVRHSEY